jgi:hypothetical protein
MKQLRLTENDRPVLTSHGVQFYLQMGTEMLLHICMRGMAAEEEPRESMHFDIDKNGFAVRW